jgi:segregation and condensation protein B
LDHRLIRHIESIIFASDHPVSAKEIARTINKALHLEVTPKEVEEGIQSLQDQYREGDYSFEIVQVNQGYVFMTKGAYHNTIGTFLKLEAGKKLTRVALETLAIIAYKQPVTRTDVDSIRGVNSDYAIQKLLEKELVIIAGRSEGPGRPLLYKASPKFFEYFGLSSEKDLPKLKDFENVAQQIGDQGPIEITNTVTDESE